MLRFIKHSTLVISKSKGLSEILQDVRTSTYQICRIEEKPHFINEYVIWLLKLERYIKDIVEKGRDCSLGAISPLSHTILLPVVKFPG